MAQGTVWLILFIIFLVAEVATAGPLISIWFCFGALAAMVAAKSGFSVLVQLTVFAAISALFIAATRPFVKKIMSKRKEERTNADRIIEQKAIVTEEINNLNATGAVKVDGKEWTARNFESNEEVIEKGTEVIVVEIRGVKAMVKKQQKQKIEMK